MKKKGNARGDVRVYDLDLEGTKSKDDPRIGKIRIMATASAQVRFTYPWLKLVCHDQFNQMMKTLRTREESVKPVQGGDSLSNFSEISFLLFKRVYSTVPDYTYVHFRQAFLSSNPCRKLTPSCVLLLSSRCASRKTVLIGLGFGLV